MPSMRYCRPKSAPVEHLVDFLVKRFPYGDENQWRSYIAQEFAWVERYPARKKQADPTRDRRIVEPPLTLRDPDLALEQGDVVRFEPPSQMEPDVDSENLLIASADDDVVVCVKNGNLPVAEGGRYMAHTLCRVLAERFPPTELDGNLGMENRKRDRGGEDVKRLLPVHRLDKETSGLVVLARNSRAASLLAPQFAHSPHGETSEFELSDDTKAMKTYEAVVDGLLDDHWWKRINELHASGDPTLQLWGCVPQETSEGRRAVVISARIGGALELAPEAVPEDQRSLMKLRMCSFPVTSTCGKTAYSMIEVIRVARELGWSFVRVRILTGRTHQIRIHCCVLGFPVVGDKLYTADDHLGAVGTSGSVSDATYLSRARGDVANPKYLCRFVSSANAADSDSDSDSSETAAVNVRTTSDGVFVSVRRHLLHSCQLSFVHPTTRQHVTLESESRSMFTHDITFDDSDVERTAATMQLIEQLLAQP